MNASSQTRGIFLNDRKTSRKSYSNTLLQDIHFAETKDPIHLWQSNNILTTQEETQNGRNKKVFDFPGFGMNVLFGDGFLHITFQGSVIHWFFVMFKSEFLDMFKVIFHGKHHHFAPPFGRRCLSKLFPSASQVKKRKHHSTMLKSPSRWWQLKSLLFSPQTLGKWSNFPSIFFQMGWFNHHQLALGGCLFPFPLANQKLMNFFSLFSLNPHFLEKTLRF